MYIDAVKIDIKKNLGYHVLLYLQVSAILAMPTPSLWSKATTNLIMYIYFISERRLSKNLTNQLKMSYPGIKRLGAQTTLLPGHR